MGKGWYQLELEVEDMMSTEGTHQAKAFLSHYQEPLLSEGIKVQAERKIETGAKAQEVYEDMATFVAKSQKTATSWRVYCNFGKEGCKQARSKITDNGMTENPGMKRNAEEEGDKIKMEVMQEIERIKKWTQRDQNKRKNNEENTGEERKRREIDYDDL